MREFAIFSFIVDVRIRFCVAMISRTKYLTTVIQTLHRSIDIEYVPFFSKFRLRCSVHQIIASKNDDFQRSFPLLYFEIIKTKAKKKVRRHSIDIICETAAHTADRKR